MLEGLTRVVAFPVVLAAMVAIWPAGAPAALGQDAGKILEILRGIPGPEQVLDIARERAQRRESEKPAAAAATTEPAPPRIMLRNGNVLRGSLGITAVPLRTPFGLLHIPVDQIVEIHFSLLVAPPVRKRIAEAIQRLGDDDFAVRERASDTLRRIGMDAIPALREAVGAPDEEVRKRAQEVLEELEQVVAAERDRGVLPLLTGRDRVTTLGFVVEGTIELDRLAVKTPSGTAAVPRQELVSVRFRRRGLQRAEVTVAASAMYPTGWVRTSIRVKKGALIEMRASGEIAVPDYGESCGPEGLARGSRALPGVRELALIGRVGRRGKPFPVGSKYKGRADAAGVLELAVVPFRYPYYRTIGRYKVVIEAR